MTEQFSYGSARVGPGDPRIRRYLTLRRGRDPDRSAAVAITGTRMIDVACRASASLEVIFVCPPLVGSSVTRELLRRLVAEGVTVLEVGEHLFGRLVDRDGPDGVAAIARTRVVTLEDLTLPRTARVLVVDEPERPGNLGSLLRSADASDASAVIVTGGRIRLQNPSVVKASMGAIFSVPALCASRGEALGWLLRHRFEVVAGDPGATSSYREARYAPRVALVVGSERLGLSAFWRSRADQLVSIPVLGVADSINVGHAGAVLLYEALHRQAGRPGEEGRDGPTQREGSHDS